MSEDKEGVVEEKTGEATDEVTETGDVTQLSPSEVEAQLAEINLDEEPAEETEEESKTKEEGAQESKPAEAEAKEEESAEKKVEEKSTEEKSEEEKEPTELEKLTVVLKDEQQKVLNQRKQMDRWANEIGEMRKLQKVVSETVITDEDFRELTEENPQEAYRRFSDHQKAEESVKKAEENISNIVGRNENEREIREVVPDIDELLPDILAMAKAKYKLSDSELEPFSRDIFAFQKHDVLSMAQEVKAATLQSKLEAAQTEIETMKTSKPDGDMLKKIDKVAKKSATVDAGSGQAPPSDGEIELSEENIIGMAPDKINKLLKERGVPI